MLQCSTVCCSAVQRVIVSSVLLCLSVAQVLAHVFVHVYVCDMSPQCVAACCSVLQHVAACCSMLQHVAACCSMFQCSTGRYNAVQRVIVKCVIVSANLTDTCACVCPSLDV